MISMLFVPKNRAYVTLHTHLVPPNIPEKMRVNNSSKKTFLKDACLGLCPIIADRDGQTFETRQVDFIFLKTHKRYRENRVF